MEPPELTVTTIRYLYATTWLPTTDREQTVAVPGGFTTALDTAANLLHTAMWELRRRGVFDFEQLRPVVNEDITAFGGQSFSRFEFLDPGYELRGLEGALIKAARNVEPLDGVLDRLIQRIRHEDERGVRRLVFAMNLHDRHPWDTVTNHCLAEAEAAGLVKKTGWALKQVEIVDLPGIQSLRERNDELRAARKADLEEREPELHEAIMADCLMAIYWARGDAS